MDTVSLFEALDQYEVQFVAVFMSPLSQVIIRATCPYGKITIAIPEKITFIDMIRDAAIGTDPVRGRDLCILAREWAREWGGMDKKIGDTHLSGSDIMLECAAGGTDWVRARDLCILAKEWGATNFRGMLTRAMICGNKGLCKLAYKWCNQIPCWI